MAQLLDLPEEVIESSILPYLSWNDLLRCRRVCKVIKTITEGYIRVNPELTPEIEISELSGEKSLKSFLAIGIPSTKLFLNNPSGNGFYDNLDTTTLNNFVKTHGPNIKSLRVVQLSLYACFNEWTFLQSLSHLKTFEAGYMGHGIVPTQYQLHEISEKNYERAETDPRIDKQNILPRNFNNLESIRIGNTCQFTDYSIGNIQNRMPIILRNCPNIKYISFPVNLHFTADVPLPTAERFNEPYDAMVLTFIDYLNSIVQHLIKKEKHVEFIDFENYHDNHEDQITRAHIMASPYFLALCMQCKESGVKLLNVNPLWFSQRPFQGNPRLAENGLGKAVLSLVNMDPCVFALEMPNLEKIEIRETSKSNVFTNDGFGYIGRRRPDWPALKVLHINVDAEDTQRSRSPQHTYLLFSMFWRNTVRVNMIEFSITFEVEDGVVKPFTKDIAAAFPNLKRLKIGGWPGKNKDLEKLWNGLPGLEEVTLEFCEGLGNKAFVGEDSRSPVFLKLKKLRKLSLRGLDKMDKLTDRLFSDVLSQMSLTHLILTSEKPIEKITKIGICSLLETEQFSKTIEHFPFTGWSLTGVSPEEFKRLGLKFRSSQML